MGPNSPVHRSEFKQMVSVSLADVGPAQEVPCQSYVNVTVRWVHPITTEIIKTSCPISLSKIKKQWYDSDRQKH
jgi:hypothetical protein